MLVTGEDLAQLSDRQLSHPSGSETIAILTGNHSAVLTVDPESQVRFSLQFTPLIGPGHPYAVISDGRTAPFASPFAPSAHTASVAGLCLQARAARPCTYSQPAKRRFRC
jgi:hypothetical protein